MEEKIIHIMDDEKVIDRTIDYFESVFPHSNKFFVLVDNDSDALRYVRNVDKVINKCSPSELKKSLDSIVRAEHIIIHMLDDKKIKILEKLKHNNITWMAWGADLYNGLLIHRGFNLYKDIDLPKKIGPISRKRRIFSFLGKFVDRLRLKRRISAIKKIKNIAAINEDYELLIHYFPELSHLKRIDFYYYPIDALLGKELANEVCHGTAIMLGNSSSPNGNHQFALEKISRCKTPPDVVIPLSYGNARYRDWLLKEIKRFSNINISVILDFLPITEYIKCLLNCGNFIYANLRQEALGNILVAFYIGGKVYIDAQSPLYRYFKQLNLFFYTLEDINDNNLCTTISDSILNHNREIIKDSFSHKKLMNLIETNFPS